MAEAMAMDNAPDSGCVFNYHVTAHKPTAVTHSLVGHFTSPTDVNLVLGCG